MKTYEHRDSDGHVISFEIRNIGRSRAVRFIERVFASATIERQQSEDFAEIHLNGKCFILNEPFGDNSRYLIHQQPPQPSAELDGLRRAFEEYQPSWLFSGDRSFTLLMLTLVALFVLIVLAVGWLS